MEMLPIRKATSEDVAAITQMINAAYMKYVPLMKIKPAPMLANYDQVVAGHNVFVGIEDDAVVAVIVLKEHKDHVMISNLAVAPKCQGRGYGKAMLQFGETYAIGKGKSSTKLYTNVLMKDNIIIYQKSGYVITGAKNEDGYQRVYFEKRL